MANQTHVTPHKEGGWQIIQDNAETALKRFDTKEEAVKEARIISQNQKTELVIHGKDGKIQEKDSHGNDPKGSQG